MATTSSVVGTSAGLSRLRDRLKSTQSSGTANYNNYAKQLTGNRSSTAASAGSTAAATANNISSYLSNQNKQLSGSKGSFSGGATNRTPARTAATGSSTTTSAQTGPPASWMALSDADKTLSAEGQAGVLAQKEAAWYARQSGDTAALQEANQKANEIRARDSGWYADSEGRGRTDLYFSAADMDNFSDQQLSDAAYAKMMHATATNDGDKAYWHDSVNDIRDDYGYTSTDGANYIPLGTLDQEYKVPSDSAGNTGGFSSGSTSFNDPYTPMMNAQNSYIANREYDPTTDPAYQAYALQFQRNGLAAANNALAQTSGNTGGIASSYAMALANAAAQSYAKQATDVIPTLQQMDYDDRLALLNSLNSQKSTAYDIYNTDRNFDWDVWKQNWLNAFNLKELAQQKELDTAQREWSTTQNQLDREFNANENQLDRDLDKYFATL